MSIKMSPPQQPTTTWTSVTAQTVAEPSKAVTSDSGAVPNGTESTNQSLNRDALDKALESINQHLAKSNMQVEYDLSAPVGHVWLNVIDQSSGAIIQKIPPDAVRKLLDNPNAAGLFIDHPA
ncbi:MAG: flagellar protein FlaG [Alicyclobacillus sp.]|nr:flagellar protein FlaG [Alicyclobacillus sp.]